MCVCEPVPIFFCHSYTVNQLGHRFRRFYSWFICQCCRSQTLRFFSPLLFFFVGAHAVFAKVLRQEVVHCVYMYVFCAVFSAVST